MNRIALRLLVIGLLAGAAFMVAGPQNPAQAEKSAPAAQEQAQSAEATPDDTQQAAAPAKAEKFAWRGSTAETVAQGFLSQLQRGDWTTAYQSGSGLLKETRTPVQFRSSLEEDGFDRITRFELTNGVPSKDGYRISGTVSLQDGYDVPFYLTLLGDEALRAQGTKKDWSHATTWTVLDIQANPSLMTRIDNGTVGGIDYFILLCSLILLGALIFMIARYVLGLRGSPRELYLMFFTKLTEYSAYGAASYCFVLYLDKDVGLGTSGATAYYTVFSLTMTIVVMVVGAVCDTIGIKKSLLIGTFMLLTARFFMPLTSNIVVTSILGFLPMAIGIAITGPVLKVGIKKFTTIEGATLGFGLFYTLMNVGFAIGGWMFDAIRVKLGDGGSTVLPILGELSTYQVILGIGFFINIPDLIAVLMMRDGAEVTEKGFIIKERKVAHNSEVDKILATTKSSRLLAMRKEVLAGLAATGAIALVIMGTQAMGIELGKWGMASLAFLGLLGGFTLIYGLMSLLGLMHPGFNRVMHGVREATEETGRRLADNFKERPFWIYLFMLGILVFVRLTFFIFHVMFPTYGIRVFGEGAMVGSIFGVLNPVLIVFLVPLISILTTKIRSYTMIFIGTLVSAGAVFLCFIPETVSLALVDSPMGALIFDHWLEVPVGQRDPFYISLIIFIVVFTVGEAIWSPRLMQFSAEIAPAGKEGSYIALAILPYFVGKALAGGMSGFLLESYTPEGALNYPDHQLVWLWIGGMAMLSPIGMVVFRKMFRKVESDAIEEAQRISNESAAEGTEDAIPAT